METGFNERGHRLTVQNKNELLPGITRGVQQATRAWRRQIAWERACAALAPTFLLLALLATGLEFGLIEAPSWGGDSGVIGLQGGHFPLLGLVLLVPLFAALSSWGVALSEASVLTEVDRRASAADRLGTAWEFSSSSSLLAASQRADAERCVETLEIGPLFALEGGRRLRSGLLCFVLLLAVVGGGLSFQLAPSQEEGLFATDDEAIAQLLDSIDAERSWFDERGDKRAVAILTDLERTIREIEAREEELERALRERPELEDFSLPPVQPQEEEAVLAQLSESDVMTVADIERMEAEFLEQLRLSDSQEAELVGQLIERSSTAEALIQRLEEHIHHEHNASFSSVDGMSAIPGQTSSTPFDDMQNGQGLTGNRQLDQAMGDVGNPIEKDMDLHTRDLSEEALIEHDATHDTQQSFNQFLQEFAGDLQEMAAEQATGRKKKKKRDKRREVKGNMGQGVADKSSAMEERGFEEVGSQKRHSSDAPPEDLAGMEPGEMSSAGSEPEGGGTMSSQMMAMKGPATGETSPGSSGAGTGNSAAGREGLKAMLQQMDPQEQNPIEDLVSQASLGRMPPEQRQALFDQLAQMQVQARGGSEADEDLVTDYFRDADELLVANREQLPPLFRDYAHDYFEAIRPDKENKEEQ